MEILQWRIFGHFSRSVEPWFSNWTKIDFEDQQLLSNKVIFPNKFSVNFRNSYNYIRSGILQDTVDGSILFLYTVDKPQMGSTVMALCVYDVSISLVNKDPTETPKKQKKQFGPSL